VADPHRPPRLPVQHTPVCRGRKPVCGVLRGVSGRMQAASLDGKPTRFPRGAAGVSHCMRTWLVLAALLGAIAPTAMASGRFGIETVRFQRLGVDAGLSQASIRTIAQDETGFLWFGTEDGLNRYDGYEFRVFRHEDDDPDGLPDNRIHALAAGRDGALWIGTENGGLARFDPLTERFRTWLPSAAPDALAAQPVTALLKHRSGVLWVASGDGRLQRLADPDAGFQAVLSAGPGPERIQRLREAADGSVLIAAGNGVWHADADGGALRRLAIDALAEGAALDVVQSFDGSVWVATAAAGVLQLTAEGQLLRRLGSAEGLVEPRAHGLLIDRAGRLWIVGMGGLSRLDTPLAPLRSWRQQGRSEDGLVAQRLETLFEDRDGLLWIGSWHNGLNLFDPQTEAFAAIRPDPDDPQSLPGHAVGALLADGSGGLWLGIHDGGGLVHFDFERGVTRRLTRQTGQGGGVPSHRVRAIVYADDGALWVGLGGGGLLLVGPDGVLRQRLRHRTGDPRSLPPGEISALRLDRQGTLWVASETGGLAARCATCSDFVRYRHDPADPASLGGNEVLALFESRSGELWIGLRHGGLNRFDRERGSFVRFPAEPANPAGLSHPAVAHISEDRRGALWIGTLGGGLNRLARDPRSGDWAFNRYTRRDGMGADAIAASIEDRHGRLWISTSAGISRLDPVTGVIDNFGPRGGALSSGYFVAAVASLPDGRLAFGGLRGLSVFDPRDVRPAPTPRQVAASEIRVFGPPDERGVVDSRRYRRVEHGRMRLWLPGDADDFHIDLTALSFAAPEDIGFEYRLDGLDPDWIATGARRRFAAYTKVPPGEYLFRARARRGGGEPGAELQLPVTVLPAPDPYAWFGPLVVGSGGLLLVVAAWLLRARARERVEAERQLRDSEERLKLALWGSGDELWDLDLRSHCLRRVNPLPHMRVGVDSEIGDARGMTDTVHADDRAEVDAAMRAVVRGSSDHLDVAYRAEGIDGRWYWLRTRGRVVARDRGGRALRLAGTVGDVSQLHEQQIALERINRELEKRVAERTQALTSTNSELESAVLALTRTQRQLVEQEKMAALGSLVAGIAHEINTPLGIGVTAASHLESASKEMRANLAEGRLTRAELDNYSRLALDGAQLILRNLQRADKLVKSFKQVAVDQTSDEQRRIDLAQYLEEIVTSLQPTLRRAKHRIETEVSGVVILDTLPGAIYQSIANLVQNSVIHGFAERSDGLIRIDARREGGDCVIDYRDDGCGMAEEVRRRVFEPFYTTRRGQGGSGLGMHIVYNLITQALRGSIVCESQPGAGARFLIRFPAILPIDALSLEASDELAG
jgi:ligand-binding sensor domain-containing protein/signal transduction histidine kinase